MAATLWVKWFYRELDFDKKTLEHILFLIEYNEAAATFFTLSRAPLNEKVVYKWDHVQSFYSGQSLPYKILPTVKGGKFIHYDVEGEHLRSNRIPNISRDISGVPFTDFERPIFEDIIKYPEFPTSSFDDFFVEPKLAFFDNQKDSTPSMARMKGKIKFYFRNNEDVFFHVTPENDEKNRQGSDTLFFLTDDINSDEFWKIQTYLFSLIILCDETDSSGKGVLLPVTILTLESAHLVCLQIRKLDNPRPVAGFVHYYEFTWLDNNSSFGESFIGRTASLIDSLLEDPEPYQDNFGSLARKRCTFILSLALSRIKHFVIQMVAGRSPHFEAFKKMENRIDFCLNRHYKKGKIGARD